MKTFMEVSKSSNVIFNALLLVNQVLVFIHIKAFPFYVVEVYHFVQESIGYKKTEYRVIIINYCYLQCLFDNCNITISHSRQL